MFLLSWILAYPDLAPICSQRFQSYSDACLSPLRLLDLLLFSVGERSNVCLCSDEMIGSLQHIVDFVILDSQIPVFLRKSLFELIFLLFDKASQLCSDLSSQETILWLHRLLQSVFGLGVSDDISHSEPLLNFFSSPSELVFFTRNVRNQIVERCLSIRERDNIDDVLALTDSLVKPIRSEDVKNRSDLILVRFWRLILRPTLSSIRREMSRTGLEDTYSVILKSRTRLHQFLNIFPLYLHFFASFS